MHWSVRFTTLAIAGCIGSWSAAAAGEPTTFILMMSQYEAIRSALLQDSMGGNRKSLLRAEHGSLR